MPRPKHNPPLIVLKKEEVKPQPQMYQPVGRDEVLTAKDLVKIRKGKSKGYTRGQLARKFGFSRKVIELVQNGHYHEWTEDTAKNCETSVPGDTRETIDGHLVVKTFPVLSGSLEVDKLVCITEDGRVWVTSRGTGSFSLDPDALQGVAQAALKSCNEVMSAYWALVNSKEST